MTDKKVKVNDELFQKIYGCLAGVAIGDALGMPSSNLRPEQIKKRYGKVTTFLSAPDDHPIHAGLKEGTITDDTELTMIVINMILEDRKVNRDGMAHRIIQWVQEKNLLATNLLGPSTTRAVQELMAGNDPATTGKRGTTNGAAMKISPIGIINVGNPIEKIVDDVEEVCLPTHWTSVAISAASAVASAVAEALTPSSTLDSVLTAAKQAAKMGEKRGVQLAYPSIEKRIELAIDLIKDKDLHEVTEILFSTIGTDVSCMNSIPSVFGLLWAAEGDPMRAILSAANMGGDADTIGCMIGGITGAFRGLKAFPPQYVVKVDKVNDLDLADRVKHLMNFIRENQ